MSDDLDLIEDYVGALAAKLDAGERGRLAKILARDLRAAQADRIKRQVDPDGAPFAARKPQRLRGRTGAIKRGAMFRKLRLAKFLRILDATPAEVAAGFKGGVGTVARVHQEGLRDRVHRGAGAKEVTYPQRRLLGFAAADRDRLLDRVLAHLDV